MRDLEKKLDALPMLPAVLQRVLELDSEDNNYYDDVMALASEDPPTAVRLLRIANSAMYAMGNPVTTIPYAMARLGVRAVVSMISAMSIAEVYIPTSRAQKNLWLHSIQTAVAARALTRHHPQYAALADTAYTVGLLHDIGRFVMFDETPEALQEVNDTRWQVTEQILEADLRNFQITHAELGMKACRKWQLPRQIYIPIQHHHDVFLYGKSELETELEAMTILVGIADRLSANVLSREDLDELGEEERRQFISDMCLLPHWEGINISVHMLDRIYPQVHSESQAMYTALGLD